MYVGGGGCVLYGGLWGVGCGLCVGGCVLWVVGCVGCGLCVMCSGVRESNECSW